MPPPKGSIEYELWKKKIGDANRGRVFSKETRELWSKQRTGEGNHNFGKTHSAETRAKITKALTGKPLSAETKAKLSVIRKELWANNTMRKAELATRARKRIHTEEERERQSANMILSLNDIWYGGVTYKEPQVNKYCEKWTASLRRRIRACWDHKSVLSGKTKEDNKRKHQLSCHHVYYHPGACCVWDEDKQGSYYYIDGEKYYIKGDPNKFVALTSAENSMVNFDKLKWIKIFEDIIEKHGGICYLPKEE